MLSIRKIRRLLKQERGQSLVEMGLMIMFVAAVVLLVNWDGLRESAGNVYLGMADSVVEKNSQTEMVEGHTETLAEKEARYKRMSTEELRQTDNAERIAMDRANIAALGEFLLTLNKSQIKSLFPGVTDDRLTGKEDSSKPGSKPGVGLVDYSIGNTGDKGEALKINLRYNSGGYLNNKQALEWMQGHYDTNTANYTDKTQYPISYRLFYSDSAIDPKPAPNVGGVQSATVWAAFDFDNAGNVTSVKMSMTRSYLVGSNWKRLSCEGLSDIVVSK